MHERIDIYLDSEVVSFFRPEAQAAIHAGSLALGDLSEHDLLLAAGITHPLDAMSGIRVGESLVVARMRQPKHNNYSVHVGSRPATQE